MLAPAAAQEPLALVGGTVYTATTGRRLQLARDRGVVGPVRHPAPAHIYWLDTKQLVSIVLTTGLVIGPVLGYVALRCRSVWPAILHYANNLGCYLR